MGIFQRLSDILKSNVNDLIDRAEDPEKMVKQIIIDMQKELNNSTQALGKAVASERIAKKQYDQAAAKSADWESKAKTAIAAGDEELAKKALANKVKADKDTAQYKEMYDTISAVEEYMPQDKPRYLMGVGTPGNIIEAVYRGVDFFDCVMPARNGRHGHLYTWEGVINIKNEKYARDERPIDPECHCPVCRKYSRAYLRHLMKAEEILALRFCVMHNLYFYNSLMEKIRAALDEGQYQAFHDRYVEKLDKRI